MQSARRTAAVTARQTAALYRLSKSVRRCFSHSSAVVRHPPTSFAFSKSRSRRSATSGKLRWTRLPADRRKQFDTAEDQLRRAMDLAPRQVGRVLDLAKYLARHGRIQESEAAFDRAERLEPNNAGVKFARARIYVEQKRNLDQARELLKSYLQSQLTPDDPSREQAEKLLRQITGA